MKKQMILSLAALAALAAGQASAYEGGDWTFKAGLTNVDPKANNKVVQVDDDTSLSLTGSYFFTSWLSLELLASLPFQHDILGGAGSVSHLPPTLSIQYHFNSDGVFIPYVGLGVNYTTFFNERIPGSGTDLSLDDSVGVAYQAGIDYMFTEQLFMNVDVRYIEIESDVEINGADAGKLEIDPITVGINVGYKF